MRRRLRFNQPAREVPSLRSASHWAVSITSLSFSKDTQWGNIVRLLVKSRVLSLLQFVGTATRDQLRRELAAKVGAVGSRRADADGNLDGLVGEVCNQLVKEQLVTASADGTTFRLASVGSALVAEQASRAELLRQQFDQSISDRVWAACSEDGARAKRVTPAALAFIAACLERRALGVALSWSAPKTDFRDYHIVALIQSLPEFMGQLSEPADALVLVRVVQELLASPTDGESQVHRFSVAGAVRCSPAGL